ncbi:MAG: stage III sporulation protein AF [Clostridiales bacterium]|nr:stage III sporulation protein AF [Clostridiales bacterium]
MAQWMKTLAVSLCILTILLHLAPENHFAKYVRFYVGLLFFLLAVSPVLELLGSGEELDRLLQLEFLKEEYYDLESAAEGLRELKNEQIQEACRQELKRQILEITDAYGLTVASVDIRFGEDGYSISSLSVFLDASDGENGGTGIAEAKKEIAGLYLLPESDIVITEQR